MKKLWISFLLICSVAAFGQTKGTAKVYGYVQSVLPGVPKGGIEVSGEESTGPGAGKNYFIYITSASRIYPSELWIDGVAYMPKTSSVSKTPVKRELNNGQSKVLVPSTTRKVWMLTPAPPQDNKQKAGSKKLAANNEVVVVYKQNGKFYYNALKKLEQLDDAAMQ
jgi:hypothetical protein